MFITTRFLLRPVMRAGAVVFALAATLALTSPARAWMHDENSNRIDDRIEHVNAVGYAAAMVGPPGEQRLGFGITFGPPMLYAIYVCYDHVPNATEAAAVSALGVPWVRPYLQFPFIRTEATFVQIQAIAALPRVTRVEVVPMMYASNHIGARVVRARDSRGYDKSQNDALFPSARQELGLDGTGIVVAIFDTGVNDDVDLVTSYPGHESLRGKFLGGGEFFYGNPLLNTPNSGSMNPQDHGAEASQYHATHVAGTAIGSGGPGGTFAGVAPKARLVDMKVLSDAGASLSGVPEAIEWCLYNKNTMWPGLAGADTIYRGIDVVNMSLGDVLSSDGTEADAIAVNVGVRGGLAIVCASGNLGMTGYIASPSSADSSICAGATTHSKSLDRADDLVTSFSQEGPRADDGDSDHFDEMKPNVVAPGNGIISADGDPTTDGSIYKSLSGTSMASPHVAGCVALLRQANPALAPLEIRAILQNTAEHNVASEKGDRPNDPFALDPNYDPGCGWGLVDVFAAAKEVANSASGVQLAQMKKPVPRVNDGAIDVGWITQREYSFQGFEVHRAPDAGGAPGTFARLNPVLVVPAGDPVIAADDNRTAYTYTDSDAALAEGETYWYRVAWVDNGSTFHPEPAVRVEYGTQPRLATVYYSIVHDAPDSDLGIRFGMSTIFDPDRANFAMLGPGAAQQDSFDFSPIDFPYLPPGHIRHHWSIGLTAADGVAGYFPPSRYHPWFLDVTEGGFADQSGRIESFSIFVNDTPGSSSGTTYVTDSPTPRPTIETTRATLWIPERPLVAVEIASFNAVSEGNGVRVTLALARPAAGATAQVFRSTSDEFATREPLTGKLLVPDMTFEHRDATAQPGVKYWYWVVLEEVDGGAFVNGPVSGMVPTVAALTFLAPASPNPAVRGSVLRYTIGADAAGGGPVAVSLALYDAQGRVVRDLVRGDESPGEHRIAWDGRDASGGAMPAGLYFLRLNAGAVSRVARLSVVR